MIIDGNRIKAKEGYYLRRKSDLAIFGDEMYLGYTYYLNGIKLDKPLLELPEHYEEVEIPTEEIHTEEQYEDNKVV